MPNDSERAKADYFAMREREQRATMADMRRHLASAYEIERLEVAIECATEVGD